MNKDLWLRVAVTQQGKYQLAGGYTQHLTALGALATPNGTLGGVMGEQPVL